MGARYASALLLLASTPAWAGPTRSGSIAWANRLTWGPSARPTPGPQLGTAAWLDQQLYHPQDDLPPEIAAQIAVMRISQKSVAELLVEEDAAARAANALPEQAQRDAARKVYAESMNALSAEAARRSLLRDIYAKDQLREQLTWFWVNHFNVFTGKADIRASVGDYEDMIRARSLGKFRDLLEATLKHPAMLRYLDSDQNAVKHINENYAREIMELHSMGVGSGYTQKDVQELARILTGIGVDLRHDPAKITPAHQALYVREGVFSFNPDRHDFGDKQFLGQTIKGSGFAEIEQALDIITRSPATARYISRQLASYFVGDNPPDRLIDKMVRSWRKSDGQIASVLRTMIQAGEFRRSFGTVMKDPVHYVVSSMRLLYGDQTISNTQPITNWLTRMGQNLYGHETPDGYPLVSASWTGPGQLMTRFESAQALAYSPGSFASSPPPAPPPVMLPIAMEASSPAPAPAAAPASAAPTPDLRTSACYQMISAQLSAQTKAALAQAKTAKEFNALFLSSPEFMRR